MNLKELTTLTHHFDQYRVVFRQRGFVYVEAEVQVKVRFLLFWTRWRTIAEPSIVRRGQLTLTMHQIWKMPPSQARSLAHKQLAKALEKSHG